MKLKFSLLLISIFSLVACLSSDEKDVYGDSLTITHEAPAPDSYSVEKNNMYSLV